jgi:hypothetical protein
VRFKARKSVEAHRRSEASYGRAVEMAEARRGRSTDRGLTIPALLGCCTNAARTLCASGPVELLANLGRSRAQLRDNRVGQREGQRNDLVINEAGVLRRRRGTVEVPRDLKLGEPTDLCRSCSWTRQFCSDFQVRYLRGRGRVARLRVGRRSGRLRLGDARPHLPVTSLGWEADVVYRPNGQFARLRLR